MTDHISTMKILSYISGKLNEEQSFHLEEHLAACVGCARRVRSYRLIGQHADSLLESFSAKKLSQHLLQRQLMEIAGKRELSSEIVHRLRAWASDFGASTRAALRITLEGARQTATIVEEGFADLLRGDGAASFQPMPVAVRVRGEGRYGSTSVEATSGLPVKITADSITGTVAVQMALIDEPRPLAVLVHSTRDQLLTAEFREVEGEDFLLATFEDLDDGDYTLLLENADQGLGD